MDVVPLEGVVLERALGVPDLLEVARGELVGVDDDRAAAAELVEVGLECRRVHGDEDVGVVARREHRVVTEVQLEGADAGQRPGWGADLGGEVGEGREVVAELRGLRREPVAGELHAIAGVTGKADHHVIQTLDGGFGDFGHRGVTA